MGGVEGIDDVAPVPVALVVGDEGIPEVEDGLPVRPWLVLSRGFAAGVPFAACHQACGHPGGCNAPQEASPRDEGAWRYRLALSAHLFDSSLRRAPHAVLRARSSSLAPPATAVGPAAAGG